jgi:hypothetical protein
MACASSQRAGRKRVTSEKIEIRGIGPPPGVVRIDIKQKGLQIGMLEVAENKGANLRLKRALMRLIERKG